MLLLFGVLIVVLSVAIYLELREAAEAPDEPEIHALAEGFLDVSQRAYHVFHSSPSSSPAELAGFLNYVFAALAVIALVFFALGTRTLMTGPKEDS